MGLAQIGDVPMAIADQEFNGLRHACLGIDADVVKGIVAIDQAGHGLDAHVAQQRRPGFGHGCQVAGSHDGDNTIHLALLVEKIAEHRDAFVGKLRIAGQQDTAHGADFIAVSLNEPGIVAADHIGVNQTDFRPGKTGLGRGFFSVFFSVAVALGQVQNIFLCLFGNIR